MASDEGLDIEALRKRVLKKRAQYEALKEEFEGMSDKLIAEFEKQLNSSLSDEEQDILLEGDALKVAKMIDKKRKVYVDDVLEEKRLELEAFEDAIEKEEEQLEDLEAEATFRASNPDVDVDGFATWLKRKVTPEELEAMQKESGGDRAKFLEIAHALYAKRNATTQTNTPDLPSDMHAVAGEKGDVDGDALANDETDVSRFYQ